MSPFSGPALPSPTELVLDAYLAKQLLRHPLADGRARQILTAHQIHQPEVDLSALRYTAHGQFLYNLHVVLEHEDGWCTVEAPFWQATRGMILGVFACLKDQLHIPPVPAF